MVQTAATIWADGPTSSPTQPLKSDIRQWGTWLETITGSFSANGGLIYLGRDSLYGDLSKPQNTMAWVVTDSNVDSNGIYMKFGAAGTGSWAKITNLPFSFVVAHATAAGTSNAIQATTDIPVTQVTLVILFIRDTNAGSPVTVSFNGTTAIPVKTMSGLDVDAGALLAGSVVAGFPVNGEFRLISDDAAATVVRTYRDSAAASVAAAAAASTSAQSARDAAIGARDSSLSYANQSSTYASQASALVTAAAAGFTGFPSTAAYDFGFITDANTYFNQDWGSV